VFIDIEELTEAHYLALMLVANLTELLPGCEVGTVVKELETTLHSDEVDLILRQLEDVRMISVVKNGTNALYDREQPGCELELTRAGFAVLLNYPNRFLRKIADRFGEIPENLTTTIIPYLNLERAPAADRYVSVKDNQKEFAGLLDQLEIIKLELVKDQNLNELPVPEKRRVINEFEGIISQIKGGFVRVSDLTVKARPLLKSIAEVCKDIRADALEAGIPEAVAKHNTLKIFDWLLNAFSYQGISDKVARGYIHKHGSATWSDIAESLGEAPPCPLLQTYWHFDGCRYDKGSFTCSEPHHIDACPVPRHRLRNGRLNQTAYSFFLFVRDVAKGDLISWIDDRLTRSATTSISPHTALASERQERLIGPLRNVYGVSDKILTMTLSGLLLGASDDRTHWFETGKGMIAIDTLVHNFLHRIGILDHCGASHAYGAGCYGHGGCAEIIRAAASHIDASAFNRRFGASAPLTASTHATATASMTASRAKTAIARCSVNVTANL
jgi:hypothetical protein